LLLSVHFTPGMLRAVTKDGDPAVDVAEVVAVLWERFADDHTAPAQENVFPVVGYCRVLGAACTSHCRLEAGLRDAGYVNGENAKIEYRWVDEDYTVLPAVMQDLLGLGVRLIVLLAAHRRCEPRRPQPRPRPSFSWPPEAWLGSRRTEAYRILWRSAASSGWGNLGPRADRRRMLCEAHPA
jgi:hypothetical protein